MRLALASWGTEGDIRPFFALAAALTARGHEVRLAYVNVDGTDLSDLARATGVAAEPVAAPYFAAHREAIATRARTTLGRANPLAQLRMILEDTLDPVADELAAAAGALASWSEAAVVHLMAHPAATAVELAGRPLAVVAFAPMFATSWRPPIGAPDLGRWLNPGLWAIARRAMDGLLGPRVNSVRARLGAPPITGVSSALLARARLALLAMSPALLVRPADWPATIAVTGELAVAGEAGPLPAALSAFLDGGAPPIYVTLGSMGTLHPDRARQVADAALAATAALGQRAIVQVPAEVAAALPAADHAAIVTRAPHAAVFPRCSAIVHHGGAGTTHAALRAGKPSVVLPLIADQPFWAGELHRRGVAARPLSATAVTARRLEKRLRSALEPAVVTRAGALGAAVAAEDGAAAAVVAVERAFA